MSKLDAGRRGPSYGATTWSRRLLWALWLSLEIIFLQGMVASYQEMEPRAAVIFAGLSLALLLAAVIVLVVRREQLL